MRPESKRRQLPVGLAYILTAVKKAGFEFDLIDMDINNISMSALKEILDRKSYDVYAFGCIVTGFKYARQIAEIIRQTNPEAIIIAGNSVADSIPQIILKHTEIDIAVLGEGDITIVELLGKIQKREDLCSVNSIAFSKDENIVFTSRRLPVRNIDDFGFPDWTIFDLEKYNEYGTININSFTQEHLISFPLNSARGCPFHCTFCYHVFKGVPYRSYSEKAIIAEMERLCRDYKCNFISFWDEVSFISIKKIESLISRIKELPYKFEWDIVTRGNLFKYEHVELIREMKASGCKSVSFSLENASPEILKAIDKHMGVGDVVEQAKALWKGGIIPLTSIIFGYPQETPETIHKTLQVCEECDIYPSAGYLLPLPGTQIYHWAKDKGYIDNELEYLERIGDRQDFHINLTQMPDDEFIREVESGLSALAKKQGLELESVLKTTTYQTPKKLRN